MHDLTTVLSDIRTAHEKTCGAKELIREGTSGLELNVKLIADACRPHCIKAAEKYNASARLQIVPDKIRLSLNPKDGKIFMKVFLKDANGVEPDEELDSEHAKKMHKALRPAINRRLRDAKIPLSLGGVCVPSFYLQR